MLLVLFLHLNLFGSFLTIKDNSFLHFSILLYEHFAIVAVNVFVIISAWFLCCSDIKLSKIINLLIPIIFWTIVISIVACCLGVQITVKDMLLQIPIIGTSYDFVTGYIVMYILAPFVNRMTNSLNQHEHKRLCLILFTLFSFIAPFVHCQYIDLNMGYHFAWFEVLYIITSYFRKYQPQNPASNRYLIMYLSLCIIATIGEFYNIPIISRRPYNNPMVAISAYALFFFFAYREIKSEKICKMVQLFSPFAFSVYLIHANSLIEKWYMTYNITQYIDTWYKYIVFVPFAATLIYIICSILEFTRLKLFKLFKIDNVVEKTIKKYIV